MDVVVCWILRDLEKFDLEVRRYAEVVILIAQTGLQYIIGRHELADLLHDREKIDQCIII